MQTQLTHFRTPVTAVVIGLLGLSTLCQAEDRDYWLKIERNGAGFGWEHARTVDRPDGQREYRIESLVKIDVIGLSPQEISLQGAFRVDQDLRPLSLSFRTRSKVQELQVSGQCLQGKMRLSTVDSGGEKREQELDCRDMFFSVTLADLISRHSGEKNFRVTLFNPSTRQLQPTDVRLERADTNEVEARVNDTATYRIERAGGVREIDMPALHMKARRTTSQEAQNITHLSTADGLTLTVQAKGAPFNPFQAKKVQIAVAWKNVPREEFRLEDKRQRILRASTSQGAHQVWLEIARIALPSAGISAPVGAQGLVEYLGEDEYIKPGDIAVRRQLSEIRGGTTEAMAIVERILKWISANISTNLIAETLSAPEVLLHRSGKCSEHAILFAALARAAGIPTRIVLGQAANGQYWTGHMWNEVWLGEWLPVDPSMGSFVVGASHLKLVDSPTVKGTQSLRMKLVDNLALETLGVELDQTVAGVELKTGIVGETYTNASYRCRISRPDTMWSMAESGRGSTAAVTLQPPGPSGGKIELTMFAVPPGSPAKTILERRIQTLASILGPLEILESNQTQIAGRAAECVAYRVRDPKEGSARTPLVNENCLLVDGANGYLFKLVFPQGEQEKARPAFDRFLTSFGRVP